NELWPSQPGDLSEPTRQFLDKKLMPLLSPQEKEQLKRADKRWPQFPRALHELTQKHHLTVPWQTLPGPRERWDNFRTKPRGGALPALRRRGLEEFAGELDRQERARLNLAPLDPSSLDRLTTEYFKRKPNELNKLRHAEQKTMK